MNYTVYVLRSMKNGRRYIGCTSDLKRRLIDHNSGKNISTKNKGPWEVVYYEQDFIKRADALKRERQLKSMKGGVQFRKILTD